MEIEIQKLSADRLEEWLRFFDNAAFSDNRDWAGCYCMCHHWNAAMQWERAWDCTETGASYNRALAGELIRTGGMQGYLAYCGGAVVGWCNANDKQAYDGVIIPLPRDAAEQDGKIKAVVCFCIAPDFRGKGIATRMLERLCADAADDGYAYIEAYPFTQNAEHSCTGPLSMYEKSGFEACGDLGGIITLSRKYL
ncbi:MAG: GNAT family N-acetyltransferase [Oscillospiraceae bacterium]